MVLIIATLPEIVAFYIEKAEEYSKEDKLHTISLKATCDTFGFRLLSLHLFGIWLMGSNYNYTVFAFDNLTIKVDGEIVDVITPVTVEIVGFKGLATFPIMFWLNHIIFKERSIFDVRVYGICNSVEFHDYYTPNTN